MRLTADEYTRGFIRWASAGPTTVQTATGPDAATLAPYSAPLTEPTGSIVTSPPGHHRDLKLNAEDAETIGTRFRLVWDRLADGDLDTLVVDFANGSGQTMTGLPNTGRFRHTVAAVPYLDWTEDAVFRVADVVVRLVKHGRLLPPGLAPALASMPNPFRSTGLGQDGLPDRFVEILTPDEATGEGDLAFSILGLFALEVGDAAAGDIVASDTREFVLQAGGTDYRVIVAGRGAYFPSSVGLTLRLPVRVTDGQMDEVDRYLSVLNAEGTIPRKLGLGLRWYERGLRAFSPTDGLLANYVGTEAVVTAVSDEQGVRSPIAALLDDERIPELLQPLVDPHGEADVERLIKRLADKRPSILDRFEAVAKDLGLATGANAAFRSMQLARNAVMHGSSQAIDSDAASAASTVLADVLRRTFEWFLANRR